MNKATQDLKQDHITASRIRYIAQICSDKLYTNENIPLEDIELISVVIEEVVDRFHHGKNKYIFHKLKTKMGLEKTFANFLLNMNLVEESPRCF